MNRTYHTTCGKRGTLRWHILIKYKCGKSLSGYRHRNVSSSSPHPLAFIAGDGYFSARWVSVPDTYSGPSAFRPAAESRDPAGSDRIRQQPGHQDSVHAGDYGY